MAFGPIYGRLLPTLAKSTLYSFLLGPHAHKLLFQEASLQSLKWVLSHLGNLAHDYDHDRDHYLMAS